MSIRLPLATILTSDNSGEVGAGSVAGGVAIPFVLPQDTDTVVVKLRASTVGGAVSALFQTTDDGGTTWYDVARTSIVSNANATTAQWLNVQVVGQPFRSAVQGQASTLGNTNVGTILQTTGSAAASSLGQYQANGMPILSQQNRIFLILTGDLTAATVLTTEVKVNSQSATA